MTSELSGTEGVEESEQISVPLAEAEGPVARVATLALVLAILKFVGVTGVPAPVMVGFK